MKSLRTALSVAALVLLATSTVIHAQTNYYEPLYKIPPAATGNNGVVFIGTRNGVIYRSAVSCDPAMALDSLVAGKQLPADLDAIWYLSMPDRKAQPNLIVGLVSYNVAGTKRYGILRSADMGATWTPIRPAALDDPAYTVSNAFYTQPLGKMFWLDANNGWIYGNKGILHTADGGLTWEQMFSAFGGGQQVKLLVFRDPDNGVAAMGTYPQGSTIGSLTYFAVTADGGRTWTELNTIVAPRIISALQCVGKGYRAIITDPFQQSSNTYFYSSNDGLTWTNRWAPYINREGGLMNEWVWTDNRHAYMMLRSGEIWETNDTAKSWANVQRADSANYPMTSSSHGGTLKGYSYSSFLLDNTYIVQTSTVKTTGELYRRPRWSTTEFQTQAGAPPEPVVALKTTSGIYPNPTTGNAAVRFTPASPGNATIVVTDLLGMERKRVELGRVEAGQQRVVPMELGDLPNGTYRYSITGFATATGTISLLR